MEDMQETRITLKSDKSAGIASKAFGAKIDAVAFNLTYLAEIDPVLTARILNDFQDAAAITTGTPAHPDEDFDLALKDIKELLK